MKKHILYLLLCGAGLAAAFSSITPSWADLEGVQPIVDGAKGVEKKAKTIQKKVSQVKKTYNNAKQGFQEIQQKAEQLKEIAENPQAFAMKAAGELQNKLQSSSGQGQTAEDVQKTYTREKDAGLEAAQIVQEAVNLTLIENTSRLYAKAMVMRQMLNQEEPEEPDLETQEGAMRAVNETMIRSLERWNNILLMMANINMYNGFNEIQNYNREAGDEE